MVEFKKVGIENCILENYPHGMKTKKERKKELYGNEYWQKIKIKVEGKKKHWM